MKKNIYSKDLHLNEHRVHLTVTRGSIEMGCLTGSQRQKKCVVKQ